MQSKTRTLTRRELYDLVWSKPMTKLAEEFGLSDRGLAKACDRHRVPVPPRGYWAKIAAGQKVKQAIFVEVNDLALNRIDISATTSNLPEETREILQRSKVERAEKAKRERRIEPPPATLEPVEKTHRVLAATARALRKAKPDGSGAVYANGQGHCGVSVHVERVERALSILDRLFRELEGHGITLDALGNKVQVSIGQDSTTFALNERTRREKHEPTEQELAKQTAEDKRRERRGWPDFSYGWNKAWPEFDTVFTGQLVFMMDGYGDGLRKKWADGKTQTVEGLLDQIVTGVLAMLSYEKARREEREESQRQWKELERRRQLQRQRKEREEKRLALLHDLMDRQREATELREWLLVVVPTAEQGTQLARMIVWARERLEALEASVAPEAIESRLDGGELFPEIDALFDPLGDPNGGHGYWR